MLNPKVGEVLSFIGATLHGGDAVILGTRYILAVFLYLDRSCTSSGLLPSSKSNVGKKHNIPSLLKEAKKKNFSFGFEMS